MGPWDLIQGYFPRTLAKRQKTVVVMRSQIHVVRFANVRSMPTYQFRLGLIWPLSSGQGSAEDDQQQFDSAIDLLLKRIMGIQLDHTHGGRFLSVAEKPEFIVVNYENPEQTVGPMASFMAEVLYSADDFEINN